MPMFNFLGGKSQSRSDSSSSSSQQSNSAAPQSRQPQQQRTTTTRHTYPGMRATAPPPGAPHQHHHQHQQYQHHAQQQQQRQPTMPSQPPRVGQFRPPPGMAATSSASNQPAMNPQYTAQNQVQNRPQQQQQTHAQSHLPQQHQQPYRTPTPAGIGGAAAAGAGGNDDAFAVDPTGKNSATGRPGAFQVSRTTSGPAQVYRVTVPPGVRPGAEFSVHAGQRRVRVRCPGNSRGGQSLQITLPPEPTTHHLRLKVAPLTSPLMDDVGGNETAVGGVVSSASDLIAGTGGAVAMTPEVQKVNREAQESGMTAQTFLVTIPPNVFPGMSFTVNVSGQRFMVTCPPNAGPNMKVRIVPPTVREEPEAAPKTQIYEVLVPMGVQPGQPFALVANGQRVLVTCPPNVVAGQKIRFELPVSQVVGNIQLSYESMSKNNTGWCRTIRATDMKFQWVRLGGNEDSVDKPEEGGDGSTKQIDLDGMDRFDFQKSAYVRKITFLEGNDARMRTGTVELGPAKDAVVDSRLVVQNQNLVSYADIASVQMKSLEEKTAWFQKVCTQLTSAWEDGHIKIVIRRKHLLYDSVDAVMSLGRTDLRKRWRVEFLGEPAIDAGGVCREWFQMVTEQAFDPAFGLWLSSANNQTCVNINPASGVSCPDDHLIYFRFLGRMLGRALFDRQLVKGHMVRSLYKHLLGWPITFEDIQNEDDEYYQSLRKLTKMDDVSLMCLDFTVTEECLGARTEVELTEGGSLTEVTNDNLAQYLEANLRYRMLDRIKPQLTELLLGFFDIVPEPALTVFDTNELELILCGLPTIDMEDWQAHTIYSGLFEGKGKSSEVVQWFWEVVRDDFDAEMKARVLQFVTGTSGVPNRGFSVLQGLDGNIKKFTIHGVDRKVYMYPRAHTCFNRIDLPTYGSKKDLYEKLKTAVSLSGVGFNME